MRGSFWKRLFIVILVFVGLGAVLKVSGGIFGDQEEKLQAKNTILQLELNGVILNGKKFLKNLEKYKKDDRVKALLVVVNSPGGAVGPSQEIYTELKRVREELKKPVVCVSTGMMASGGYYSALGCDKIVVAPGALIGSIGVVMQFANLQGLYDWAKVSRYSITSGKFKDSGAEYRAMRDDERALFQSMIDEVYAQFKDKVMSERKLKEEVVTEYADGRVFTGSTAVKLGFADKEGYFEDAVKLTAELADLGDDYKIFEVPKKRMSIFDLGGGQEEDEINSVAEYADILKSQKAGINIEGVMKFVLQIKFLNQPMYLMPGTWE